MPRERVRKKKTASPATTPQPNAGQQRPFSVSPGDSSCSSDSLFSGSGHVPGHGNYGPPPPHMQHHSPYGNHYGPPPPMNPGPHPHQQQHHPQQSMYPPSNQSMYSCSKCHKAINERTVSMCDNRFWHSACLTCQICGHAPSPHSGESLYAYNGSLICKPDYMRKKCVCSCCNRPITPSDMVIRAKNFGLLHDKCVFCRMCNSRLHPGDRYWWTTDNMLVCQKCVGPNGSTMMAGGGQMMAGPNGGQMMGGPNGPQMIKMEHNGPGPMDGYHMGPGHHHQQQQQQQQQHQQHQQQMQGRQMGPGGGPPNGPYMGGPNGGGGQMMGGPNGPQMVKMEHNGYGNGMNGMGHHMGHGQPGPPPQHMSHHHQVQQGPGTPGATPTPPPTTGGRRGRKKAAPPM